MTYSVCLKPWAIAQQLPSGRWAIIARYRSRSDVVCEAWCEAALDIYDYYVREFPISTLKWCSIC
jgi:hypothetical protein